MPGGPTGGMPPEPLDEEKFSRVGRKGGKALLADRMYPRLEERTLRGGAHFVTKNRADEIHDHRGGSI
jgi:general stress protein YciG